MNKMIFCFMALGFAMSCASTGDSAAAGVGTGSGTRTGETQDDILLWANPLKLIGVYINGTDTQYRRNAVINDNGFFTLQFTASAVAGKGAPNSYSGPYTIKDGVISIMPMRSTLMASFFEPENLKEHEFYIYVQNTYKRAIVNNKMELYSKTEDGRDVRLVFEP